MKISFPKTLNTRAFTLIELLIVVLIIGILAAIALPQYQLARDKAEYAHLINAAKVLKDANERYYLMYQRYSGDTDNLDINLSYNSKTKTETYTRLTFDWGDCRMMDASYAYCNLNYPVVEYVLYYDKYGSKAMCYAMINEPRAEKLCRVVTGKESPESASGSWSRYLF